MPNNLLPGARVTVTARHLGRIKTFSGTYQSESPTPKGSFLVIKPDDGGEPYKARPTNVSLVS